MPSSLVAKGRGGELRLGYQVAATLGAWTLEGDRVDAQSMEPGAFWGMPGELSLWLQMGRRFWVWRAITVISETPLAIRVHGAPSVRG